MLKKVLSWLKRQRKPIAFWRAKGAKIGTSCDIHPKASLGSEPYLVTIGNNVRVSANVCIFTHDGGLWVLRSLYEDVKNADKFDKVVIGSNVHVGVNAMIMPGVTIGDNCVIGAGAIVTKDIPACSVAVGVPARVIETVEEYYEKVKDKVDDTKKMTPSEKKAYVIEKYK